MVLPLKKFSSQKCRGGGTLAKNAVFGHFSCRPPLTKVKNCYSDNFDASGLAHGSFEALWATVKWQHWKSGNFFSKLGSQPPLKSAYPGSCPPKKLFLGRFFLENHFFDPFRPNEDPQVLYMAGKLWISSLWWYKEKNIFFASCRAYDFLGRSAQIFSFILRSCHIYLRLGCIVALVTFVLLFSTVVWVPSM